MNSLKIIPSKSVAHRAYICQALAGGDLNEIIIDENSNDMKITKNALEKIFSHKSDDILDIDCEDSGSSLRFLLPLVLVLGINTIFTMKKSLAERPMVEFEKELENHGAIIRRYEYNKLHVRGKLTSGIYFLPGNISSQYISGLLLSLPFLEGESKILLTTDLESKSYIDITNKVLHDFGIKIEEEKKLGLYSYKISKCNRYEAVEDYEVEGDWSNGSYMIVAVAIGKKVGLLNLDFVIEGLNLDSVQGDKSILNILKMFDIYTVIESKTLDVRWEKINKNNYIRHIDAREIPDIIPIISLMAAISKGVTIIKNIKRLKYKESNRVETVIYVLKKLNIDYKLESNQLTIIGDDTIINHKDNKNYNELEFYGFKDHRIIMMESILAIATRKEIVIEGSDAISKSYPDFFSHLQSMNINFVRQM